MPFLRRASAPLAFLLLAGCARKAEPDAMMAMPPTPVTVAKATVEPVSRQIQAVGNVEAVATVQVRAQVEGQLLRTGFSEGQIVAKDQLLFEVDPRSYREALRQAEAGVARDRADIRQAEATLAQNEAQARNADAEAARYAQLVKAGDISRSQEDRVRTNADVYRETGRAARAQIERAKASLEAGLSAVDRAKLDLSWCQIKAPITGRTGSVLAHPGNIVRANETPLVVIHQTAPIYVTFAVPEPQLPAVRSAMAKGKVPVEVTLADGSKASGAIAVLDNGVDQQTGTIRLKASFDNRDGKLFHGMFVTVTLTLGTVSDATIVPTEAVQPGPQGSFVYVVKADGSAEMRPVTTGHSAGRRTVIEKGVAPGETVITDGHLRLFPGAKVQIVEASKVEGTKL